MLVNTTIVLASLSVTQQDYPRSEVRVNYTHMHIMTLVRIPVLIDSSSRPLALTSF